MAKLSTDIRVYALDFEDAFEDEEHTVELTTEDFINTAEENGLVWTLSGFEEEFNAGGISDQWMIKIV